MNARAVAAVALVLLLLPLVQVQTASGSHATPQPNSTTTWWGPTNPADGHHIRVPVTVQNPLDAPVGTLTVRAEIDLAKALAEAGWPHVGTANRPLLKAFQLDEDSVRVVRVSGLEGGRILTQDPSRPTLGGYDLRALVPSLVVDDFVSQVRKGNPSTEPLLTVYWQAHDLGARGATGDTQYFHVYLDTRTNGDHGPAPIDGTDVGAVEALHWTGAGTEFFGAVPPTNPDTEDTPSVTVLGLHPDTRVIVEAREGSASFGKLDLNGDFILGVGQAREAVLSGTGAATTEFHLYSPNNKPFVVLTEHTGFVPSLDGGLAGREFLLQTPSGGPQSLNVISTDGGSSVVTATNMQTGATSTFRLDSGQNRLPYTVGLWSNGCPANPPAGTAALSPGTVYRLRVDSGSDVLVQTSAPSRLQQVPAMDGGPTGTDFAFPLVQTFYDGSCRQSRDTRSWTVMAAEDTEAHLDNPYEGSGQIDPSAGGTHAVAAGPKYLPPRSSNGGLVDRPVFAHTSDEATAFAGTLGTGTVTTSGPLARDGGLAASGIGRAVVFAYHDETTVHLTVDRFVSGTTTETVFLSRGGSFTIENLPGGDQVSGWSLSADRPVVAYGLGGRPGYLAGSPLTATNVATPTDATPDVTVGTAEFRGYLLQVASVDGVEPQTRSIKPTESATYSFAVTNLARGHDGAPLPDEARFEDVGAPPGWTVDLDRTVAALSPGATEVVKMTVTPPKGVEARSSASVQLQATSAGNPDLSSSSGTVTFIRSSFAVRAWFAEDLSTAREQPGEQGQDNVFRVVVANEGTSRDQIDLGLEGLPAPSEGEETWTATVLRSSDQQPVSQLDLDAGQEETLDLVVTPPSDETNGLQVLRLKATSGKQASASSTVTAIAFISADHKVLASAPERSKQVLPGAEVAFPILVSNDGEGPLDMDLDTAGDLPPGWGAPQLFLVHPTTGERTPITGLVVKPGQALTFVVTTKAPEGALAGDLATVRVLARDPLGDPVFELAFAAVTAAAHALTTTPSASPLLARVDGTPTTFEATVSNAGNLDEALRVDAANIPAGWNLAPPEAPVAVAMGKQAVVPLALTGPVGAAAQEFDLVVRFRSTDGTTHEMTVPVAVPDASGIAVSTRDVEPGQPGRAVRLPVDVVNVGNAPVRVSVTAPDDEPWKPTPVEVVQLPPGGSRRLDIGWMVPASAPVGASDHALLVVTEPVGGGAAATRLVEATVDVDRPQVRLETSPPRSAPGGTLVLATLHNEGARTAHEVRVQLRSGGKVVDEVVVSFLEGGRTASLSLIDEERHERLEVVVDPDDTVVEANEADNAAVLRGSTQGSPGAAAWSVFLVLALGAWVTRRSRQ